jgi:hypothetical protein
MNDPRIILDAKTVRFRDAVSRVRKYDGNAAIGMATNTEIERLEKLADQFEERAQVSRANEPRNAAMVALAGLWTRYHQARHQVTQWQTELRSHQQVLSILGMPIGYLKEPEAIASQMPSFKTAEEHEAFNAKFAHKVADIEMKATTLKNYCQQWTGLTMEQQNRKLILALAERI